MMSGKKHDIATDYAAFLEAPSIDGSLPGANASTDSSTTATQTTASQWKKKIHRDLVKSPQQMATFYLGISVVGYLSSLVICAQNTIGLSWFSHSVANGLHQIPDPWCPILCGSVFTGVPFVLSLFFLNRFQHRYLIFKMWWFFAAIPLAATGIMLLLPHGLQHARLDASLVPSVSRPEVLSDGAWMALWAASAILLPYLLEGVVYLFVRPKKFHGIL